MSSSLLERASVSDDVDAFLVRHDAHREMELVYRLIEQCFPVAQALDVYLQDDPDEEDRQQIVFFPILPAATAVEDVSLGVRQFHDAICQGLPPVRQALFSLVPDFSVN